MAERQTIQLQILETINNTKRQIRQPLTLRSVSGEREGKFVDKHIDMAGEFYCIHPQEQPLGWRASITGPPSIRTHRVARVIDFGP